VSPEAWLSTWSGPSSRANILHCGAHMTLPTLMIAYTGDHSIFPSDNADIERSLATNDLTRVELDADHYGFPDASGREPAVATIADWLTRAR
jgi:hypothetical protein